MRLKLKPGMKVADLGAGTGHYARAAAAIVGRDGKVYAVDVQEGILKHAHLNMPAHGHGVVEYVWGNIEHPGGTKLREHTVDAAILANTLFQIESAHRAGLIEEIKRILKPGGRLEVVDWAGAYGGMGPDPEHVVTEHTAERLFIDEGFHKEDAFRAGPHHWGLIFAL
ncbi:MAG: class I SAM-dependent methyltransferase [Deltaproteobacteria bacterium]|nr:class I SAM-dependent methyltransferase [Deltaproteobacteria bacterium]